MEKKFTAEVRIQKHNMNERHYSIVDTIL